MEAFIIYGYKLTEEEVASLPADVPEIWVEKGWLIGSDNSNNWYFAQDVVNTDEQFDLEIMPEFFSGSTHEEFEQFNKRRQEFYKFFSSKQPKFFLILRETDNYYLDSYFMNGIRGAGAHKILGI